MTMTALASYLFQTKPDGMDYDQAAQLCLRLYCTVDGVPEQLLPLTKEKLGDSFAELTKAGWVREENSHWSSIYGATLHQMTDRGHWIEVIASLYKKGPEVRDPERAEALARAVDFGDKPRKEG
jgi:hypothetical protein